MFGETVISLVTRYVAFVAADHLGGSGITAVVVASTQGLVPIAVALTVSCLIVLTASQVAAWLADCPVWIDV